MAQRTKSKKPKAVPLKDMEGLEAAVTQQTKLVQTLESELNERTTEITQLIKSTTNQVEPSQNAPPQPSIATQLKQKFKEEEDTEKKLMEARSHHERLVHNLRLLYKNYNAPQTGSKSKSKPLNDRLDQSALRELPGGSNDIRIPKEIPRSEIHFDEDSAYLMGKSQFTTVYRGMLFGQEVAFKRLTDSNHWNPETTGIVRSECLKLAA